jgi:hypothetical protein
VAWFIKRFGLLEVVRKPLRSVFAPILVRGLRARKFKFKGEELNCFYHRYNMTWATERCVEVPIGRFYCAQRNHDELLEVGNVLSHYGPIQHDVLDKFEKAAGIINQDVLDFEPKRRYGLILSISTFEHFGFDDDTGGSSGEKILEAIQRCRRLLSSEGMLAITVPIGYNPELDALIANGRLPAGAQYFLRRTGPQAWEPSSMEEAISCQYGRPFPYANAILVAEFGHLPP